MWAIALPFLDTNRSFPKYCTDHPTLYPFTVHTLPLSNIPLLHTLLSLSTISHPALSLPLSRTLPISCQLIFSHTSYLEYSRGLFVLFRRSMWPGWGTVDRWSSDKIQATGETECEGASAAHSRVHRHAAADHGFRWEEPSHQHQSLAFHGKLHQQ